MSAFEPVLDALLRASLYGGFFIGAVWAVCRLFPRLPASVRCGLWSMLIPGRPTAAWRPQRRQGLWLLRWTRRFPSLQRGRATRVLTG